MARKPWDDLSPRYRQRIERAITKGKTLQQARGHKQKEHVYRREREREEYGITRAEISTARRWANTKYNPQGYGGKPDPEEVVEQAMEEGYDWFRNFRKTWEGARRKFNREYERGKYETGGLSYLNELTATAAAPDTNWLYYHS